MSKKPKKRKLKKNTKKQHADRIPNSKLITKNFNPS